jgi:hypothetical protein
MKHLLSLLVIVLLFLSNARAEDRACIDNLRTRLNELEQVTDLFHVNHGGEYIDKQLAKQQKNAEFAWAEWMQDTRKRLDDYANDVKHTLKKKLSEEALADACKQLNERFTQMKESILTESRKFQTLSNASKARHEMAMNAIRNMKA